MRIILISNNRRFADPAEPYQHVAAGLRRIGHHVEIVARSLCWPLWQGSADAVIVWNGIKGAWGVICERSRRAGARVVVMERGFFDRMAHTQLDGRGFGHRASWAGSLDQPAPPEGPERFARAWGAAPVPPRPRRRGYVLVLGQVPHDAQLRDSEIHHVGPLVQAVENTTPREIDIRVRPHPLSSWRRPGDSRAALASGDLRATVAGARFAVTINSNAGNEALAWGCPVLAMGPSLYAMAGAAMQTSLSEMAASVRLMLDGWRAGRETAANYLHHLACRQWTCGELAEGTVLRRLLDDAA